MTELARVFVTGVYGSGKTRFADRYGRRHRLPRVHFDRVYRYDLKERQSGKILEGLPAAFVIDAIPFDENGTWADFAAYEARNDVLVVCVFCPDRDAWLRRVQEKRDADRRMGGAGETPRETVKRWLRRAGLRPEEPLTIDAAHHLGKYRNFFRQNVPLLSGFRHVRYYDSIRGAYATREEMLDRIRFRCFPLEDHLAGLGKDHDWKYQDIEAIGLVGYSESYRTWARIRDLVDWKGKRVADLGCFHGYFCFKAEDAGAEALGFDRSPAVLAVARMINDVRGGRAVFSEWVGGDELPECDVVLCLNVLHHFADRDKAVSRMRCRQAIFEIKEELRPVVENYFEVTRRLESHRADRCILLCARRGA